MLSTSSLSSDGSKSPSYRAFANVKAAKAAARRRESLARKKAAEAKKKASAKKSSGSSSDSDCDDDKVMDVVTKRCRDPRSGKGVGRRQNDNVKHQRRWVGSRPRKTRKEREKKCTAKGKRLSRKGNYCVQKGSPRSSSASSSGSASSSSSPSSSPRRGSRTGRRITRGGLQGGQQKAFLKRLSAV